MQLLAEDADVVEELRWTLYADTLAESATINLEHEAKQLTHAEQDTNAVSEQQRKALQRLRMAELRLEIAEAFKARAAVRSLLLLPEVVPGRG